MIFLYNPGLPETQANSVSLSLQTLGLQVHTNMSGCLFSLEKPYNT